MWNRKDLKARGKIAFKSNYWRCVLVAFLATLISGQITSATGKQEVESLASGGGFAGSFQPSLGEIALFGGIAFGSVLLVILIDVLLVNPLIVGCNNFFLCNRRNSNTDLEALERGFKPNYKNSVIVMLMTRLIIFAWTLLLIVPGIIKYYEYYMVEYILSENPDIDYHDAMAISKQMMEGHKMNTFILELSFIGWILLGGLTLGLLNLFYVNPYMEATKAELYVELAHPSETNFINPDEGRAKTVEFTVEEM